MNNVPDAGNNEQQCYQASNTAEGGGNLTETATVGSPCGAQYPYSSGAVQMRSFTFTYGTVEVRARLAGGTGPWPAIWLLGAGCMPWRVGHHCNPPWPSPGSDEIDIAEILNSQHSSVNQQIHASAGSPGCMPSATDTSKNFHVYTLVWAPGALTWKIDGTTTCTQTGSVVPSHPMFLILDTAVGGAGGTPNNSTLPQTSSFDYVRVTP